VYTGIASWLMVEKHIVLVIAVHPTRQEFSCVYTPIVFTVMGRLNFDSIFESEGGGDFFFCCYEITKKSPAFACAFLYHSYL
jgi:hypothetical protein